MIVFHCCGVRSSVTVMELFIYCRIKSDKLYVNKSEVVAERRFSIGSVREPATVEMHFQSDHITV